MKGYHIYLFNIFFKQDKMFKNTVKQRFVMTHSELARHEGALISCFCAAGAGGLLDGVLYMIIHRHGHLHTHTEKKTFNKGIGITI